jgi:NAD(P)-dependent dehydrogenase (short-subunit alcohol dehydrogenase family)
MLLENKNAVIYGAGGAIGGATARAFAREGARVFLTGHHMAALEAVRVTTSFREFCTVAGWRPGMGTSACWS